jgi:hypothetical protein
MTSTEIFNQCVKLKRQKKSVSKFLSDIGFSSNQVKTFKKNLTLLINAPTVISKKKNNERHLNNKAVIQLNLPEINNVSEDDWKSGLKYTAKYVYNKENDKYVVHLKAANGNIVLPGDTVRGIFQNYSNWYNNEKSINEICRNYKIPRNYFTELKNVFGITHDSEPFTPEELIERDLHEMTDDVLQKKKFQLHQEFQRKSWQQTEEAASKWFKFEEGIFNPFTNFLSSWVPPKYTQLKKEKNAKAIRKSKALVVGLSDIHFGAKTNFKESYRNKGYSTEDAVKCLELYAENIEKVSEERTYNIDECVLVSLGDILHTTGAGFTTKGTMLVHDCIKEEQFNIAFNAIVKFINSLIALFPKVTVKSVKGNHNDFGDYVLFKALECYYRSCKNISFEVFQTDHGIFKLKNNLFVISHGYSAEYKGRIPSSSKARESYIANLFLAKPESLIGIKQKILLTADQHHLEMKEYAEFEHYMLSTTVKGDKHSEAMGLNNIPRQSSFVIDDEGIKEVLYSYGH